MLLEMRSMSLRMQRMQAEMNSREAQSAGHNITKRGRSNERQHIVDKAMHSSSDI